MPPRISALFDRAWIQIVCGLALLAIVVVWPIAFSSPTLGDQHIRWTIRLALAFYASAAALMLCLRGADDWSAATWRGRLARSLWILGWFTYAVHVALAMHHYHHWSHAHAVEHTRQVAGIGEGIYMSHLFGLWWGLDAVCWWLAPARYAGRSPAMGIALHTFIGGVRGGDHPRGGDRGDGGVDGGVVRGKREEEGARPLRRRRQFQI